MVTPCKTLNTQLKNVNGAKTEIQDHSSRYDKSDPVFHKLQIAIGSLPLTAVSNLLRFRSQVELAYRRDALEHPKLARKANEVMLFIPFR